MSYADELFVKMCRDILDNGTDTKGEKVRPKWEDTNESAYTIKRFGVVNRYDLRKEFPALTLRKTALKSCMDEILWIYQKKSNNVNDLHSHIWDAWADENGSIGTCYGDVVGRKFIYKEEETDQMDYVLRQLKENPYSRRIMTNLYQFEYLHSGALDPCCYSMTYSVTKEPEEKAAVAKQKKQQRRARRKQETRDNLAKEEILQDDRFFVIAGYTSGGAPYGVTWEEMGLKPWEDLEENN